jgi:hypothetical protein
MARRRSYKNTIKKHKTKKNKNKSIRNKLRKMMRKKNKRTIGVKRRFIPF